MNATDPPLCQIVLQRQELCHQIRRHSNFFQNGFPVVELTPILLLDAALPECGMQPPSHESHYNGCR
jgi:hypothetical protein